MSQGSYSFARTLSAKRARQDAREYTRSFTTGTIPLMAERDRREQPSVSEGGERESLSRKFSLKVEQLPDFGPWAIAYTADAGVKELPLMESYFFVKVPG